LTQHESGSGLASAAQTENALAILGRSPEARERLVQACLEIERTLAHGGSIRDEVTGPIVDATFEPNELVRKRLSTGEVFELRYRSKIAREFVMSWPREPDHVWEPQTTKTLVRLASGARHALVGGAYFGDHVVLMAKAMLARGGVCHAFEPNVDQCSSLRRNVEINALSNVEIHRMGLWSREDIQLRLEGEDSHAHSVAASSSDSATFSTATIDGYVAARGLPGLDLVMLDIEGGELEVLRGAANELSRDKESAPAVVFEVHRHYVDWTEGLHRTEVVRWLTDHGYRAFAIRDFNSNQNMAGRPIELVPAESAYLAGPAHGFNMLAVKSDTKLALLGDWKLCPDVSPKLLLHRDPALHHPTDGLP